MPRRFFACLVALVTCVAASGAMAQRWSVEEPSAKVARASICPSGEEGTDDFLCFRLECSTLEPLHFTLDIAGRGDLSSPIDVGVDVDGGEVGTLAFTPHPGDGFTHLTAEFNPRVHDEMVDLLQRGRRAALFLDLPTGEEEIRVPLGGSADALYTAMQACPKPAPPVDDPAGVVYDEVARECGDLGGEVNVEDGFERFEDLDGDGTEDRVIDYAAAACSEAVTLNCGTGGCRVGFFMARDAGFVRMFDDVVRGYEVFPGGFLALDLHGSACGLYGFEACRKVFDVAGNAPVLVEEIAGPEAETVVISGTPVPEDAGDGPKIVVVESADSAEAETPSEATPAEPTVQMAAATGPLAPASDDGPTSRHDAGPAPAVPADAAFRADGTYIWPDASDAPDAAQ